MVYGGGRGRKLAGFSRIKLVLGGEGGIRTRVGVLPQTRFPGVRLKPLIHLSGTGNYTGLRRDDRGGSGLSGGEPAQAVELLIEEHRDDDDHRAMHGP